MKHPSPGAWWEASKGTEHDHDLAKAPLRTTLAAPARRCRLTAGGCASSDLSGQIQYKACPLLHQIKDDSGTVCAPGRGVPTVSPGAAVWHVQKWTDKDDSLDWQA